MKLLVDFFPIVLFFVAYKLAGIYVATVVAIITAFIQIAYTLIRTRRVDPLQIVTLILLIVLGGATLWLHNELFIKWKPTLINWLFGIIFLASSIFGKKPFIQKLMQDHVQLPDKIWQRLNRGWIGFFLFMGAINLWVIYNFNTDIWVNFKLFGMLGLTLIFVVLQAIYLSKHVKPE